MSDKDDMAAVAAEHGWKVTPNGPHSAVYERDVIVPGDDEIVVALSEHGHKPNELLAARYDHWGEALEAAYFGFWSQDPETGVHQQAERHLTKVRRAIVFSLTENRDMVARFNSP